PGSIVSLRCRSGTRGCLPAFPTRRSSDLGSEEAVDVTGAGDTVIAAFTLALAAGADFFHAAQIANSAAGQKSAPAESASVNAAIDRKSTRLNSSHVANSDAVLCLKKQQQV